MPTAPKPPAHDPHSRAIGVSGPSRLEGHLDTTVPAAPQAEAAAPEIPQPIEGYGLLSGGLLDGALPTGLYEGVRPAEDERPSEVATLVEPPPPTSWRAQALQAAGRLREMGLTLHSEVRSASLDAAWQWAPMCAEEHALAHLAAGPVQLEDLHRALQAPRKEITSLIGALEAKGLVELGHGAARATANGSAVIASRLVELEADQAVALGAAQMFGAGLALQAGGLDHKGYAQALLNLVNRGGDPERRLSLLFVASVAAEEAAANLEPGANRPQGLDDLADYLRWTLPPALRPLAEEPLQRLHGAQAISDHWAALQEARAQGSDALRALVGRAESYAEAEGVYTLPTLRGKTALSLQAIEDAGLSSPMEAARIARAALSGAAGLGAPEGAWDPISLDQAMAVMNPLVAAKAVLSQDAARAAFHGLQASRAEALALAYQLVRPVLAARDYRSTDAHADLVHLMAELGHPLGERDQEHLRDAIHAAARVDGGMAEMLGPLRLARTTAERQEAFRHLALSIASSEAARMEEQEAVGGAVEPERFGAALHALSLISHGADVADLQRVHHAASLLAVHPAADEDLRAEAERVSATTRTLLVAVAGLVPTAQARAELAGELGRRDLAVPELVNALRAITRGEDLRVKASIPWPDTFADASLTAFAEAARLGELREAFTLSMVDPDWAQNAARAHRMGDEFDPQTWELPPFRVQMERVRHLEDEEQFGSSVTAESSLRDFTQSERVRAEFQLNARQRAWASRNPYPRDTASWLRTAFALPAQDAPLGLSRMEYVRHLANEEPFRDYGLFVVTRGPGAGARPHGVFLVEAREELPMVAALAGVNSFSCELVKLGDNIPSTLVDEAKEALQRAGIAFSVFEISDEELARAYAP